MKVRHFEWCTSGVRVLNKRFVLSLCFIVAFPGLLSAQETKYYLESRNYIGDEVSPFSTQAERDFRNGLGKFRAKKQKKAGQQPLDDEAKRRGLQGEAYSIDDNLEKSLFDDQFNTPLATTFKEGTFGKKQFDSLSSGFDFNDKKVSKKRNSFSTKISRDNRQPRRRRNRFEPNGGELKNVELRSGQRQRRLSRANSSSDRRHQNRERDPALNQDTIIDRNAIAILEGRAGNNQQGASNAQGLIRDGANASFEEEFLASERELAGNQQGENSLGDGNERDASNQQGPQRIITQQRGRRVTGRQARAQQVRGRGRGNGRRNARRQTAGNGRQQNPADSNDITGSIRNTELEDTYAPVGKRVGSFILFPEVTVAGVVSDNPRASVRNGPGDEAIEIVPNLVMQSDWVRHSLQMRGQIQKGYYQELTSENIDQYLVSATGRIDIEANHNLELEVRHQKTQDSRGGLDSLSSNSELADLNTLLLSAVYNYQWNRTSMSLRGSVNEFDYEDVVDNLVTNINNDDQDYRETNLGARLGYTVHSGLNVSVEGNFVNRDFESSVDDNGSQRGSEGQNYQLGVIHDLTSKVRIGASIGYQGVYADDKRFKDVEDLVYEASLNYRPSRQTSLTLTTSKSYDQSVNAGAIAVEEINHSIALNHYFQPQILMNATIQHEEEMFEGINQSQKTLSTELNLQYIFNNHARLIAGYEFTDVTTNAGGDYQENQFRLGLNLRP